MLGKMDVAGLTDRGRVREGNEDQFLIADLARQARVRSCSMSYDTGQALSEETQGRLLAVADGMGGHAAGERASQLAVETAARHIVDHLPIDVQGSACSRLQGELRKAALACQTRIEHEMDVFPDYGGMGSTLTLGYLSWPGLYLLHVGDSRCYLLRQGALRLLTTDHNAAQIAAASGYACSDAVIAKQLRSRLWNVLGGGDPDLHAEVSSLELRVGDCLLFCSDGVSDALDEETIIRLLTTNDASQAACNALITEANRRDGSDNITAVVAKFHDKTSAAAARDAETVDLSRWVATNKNVPARDAPVAKKSPVAQPH